MSAHLDLSSLADRGLPYDFLVRPIHLPVVIELSERIPNLRFVIDHMAKPEEFEGWAGHMEQIAQNPRAYMKLSGLYVDPSRMKPYVAHLVQQRRPEVGVASRHAAQRRGESCVSANCTEILLTSLLSQ